MKPPITADEYESKILRSIKSQGCHGLSLRSLTKNHVWGDITEQDLWTALSRLAVAGKIEKCGSHQYKSYRAIKGAI